MSAVLDIDRALGPDGVRRYHTSCKVLIHSHVNGSFKVSSDVVSIQCEKNIKGVGSLTLTLLGTYNYLNAIHPNDYINAYFDRGHGGWIRTFFGFVDRVTETHVVAEDGTPSTHYSVRCSDFQKAFEKTQIYLNPWLGTRADFTNQFGITNIGGAAMISRGITAFGSPADIVRNLVMLQFGFASQYILPESYGTNNAVINDNRYHRAEFLKGQLGTVTRSALLSLGSFEKLKEAIDAETSALAEALVKLPRKDVVNILANKYGVATHNIGENADLSDPMVIQRLTSQPYLAKRLEVSDAQYNASDPYILQSLGTLEASKRFSLLDLIDIYSLFEQPTIDGWRINVGIWTTEGALGQLLRSFAHEELNELFFDLRPKTIEEDGDRYSTGPDELEGNTQDSETSEDGICYTPHIVMREYPFGTINSVDGRNFHISLPETGENVEIVNKDLEIGALFSDFPNKPGRHVIHRPAQNAALRSDPTSPLAAKHLDVAVIHSEEIISTDLSRGDTDHINLFECWPSDVLSADMKYQMSDLLPIATPIHIMRHGLRVRRWATAWAQQNADYSKLKKSLSVADANLLKKTISDNPSVSLGEVPTDLFKDLTTPPKPSESPVSNGIPGIPEPSVTQNVVLPVNVGSGSTGKVTSPYGYRRKLPNGSVTFSSSTTLKEGGFWVFHNGVDIGGPIGEPVYAVMDGFVVASVPNGVLDGYGDTVIIKHATTKYSEPIYSLYAHLSSREVGKEVTALGKPGRIAGMAQDLFSLGVFTPVQVKAGDKIGEIGITKGHSGAPTFFKSKSSSHLHFEYIVKRDGRIYPSQFKGSPTVISANETASEGTPDVVIPPDVEVPRPPYDNPRSINPEDLNQSFGVPFTRANASSIPENEQIADAEDIMDSSDLGDNQDNSPTVGTDVAAINKEVKDAERKGAEGDIISSDTPGTRVQLIRWAIMQDHWYQHNMEYLSGTISMRGAPEIRVGYRLDIKDKNMSFYVEGVQHSWQYPDELTTILTVTRGQSNNPFPMYVLPAVPEYGATVQRNGNTRLGYFQMTADPVSVSSALVLRGTSQGYALIDPNYRSTVSDVDGSHVNIVDMPLFSETFSLSKDSSTAVLDSNYMDYVQHAEVNTSDSGLTGDIFTDQEILGITTPLDAILGQNLEGTAKK